MAHEKYINKNYAATFIVWDRLFNTYQEEEEQVEYGVTHRFEKKQIGYISFSTNPDRYWRDLKMGERFKQDGLTVSAIEGLLP